MDIDETMVEQNDDVEADDALPEDVVEEEDESEESLESLMGEEEEKPEEPKEDEEQPEEDQEPDKSHGASEPGWIKKRVDKAVQKALAEQATQMRAEFEAKMAPFREKMLEDEARELVRQGTVKDLETAKELVRYRQGQPQPAQPSGGEQPRNDKGQFAPKQEQGTDPATSARIEMLKHQANTIKGKNGPDVIAEFRNNEEIKMKVIRGEMDFYDVAEYMNSQRSKKKPSAPARSPNGASGSNKPNAIESMTDEQFERMERNIKEKGTRYALR